MVAKFLKSSIVCHQPISMISRQWPISMISRQWPLALVTGDLQPRSPVIGAYISVLSLAHTFGDLNPKGRLVNPSSPSLYFLIFISKNIIYASYLPLRLVAWSGNHRVDDRPPSSPSSSPILMSPDNHDVRPVSLHFINETCFYMHLNTVCTYTRSGTLWDIGGCHPTISSLLIIQLFLRICHSNVCIRFI